jgi:biopolymer transport protein ExbB
MSFNLLHIWASMGMMSKLVAAFLLLMAAMSIAVVVERWIVLTRSESTTRKFLTVLSPALDAQRYTEVPGLATEHRNSPFARLVGPVIAKLTRGDDGELSLVELARREVERQKETISGELRRGLNVLASVGSIAPFVGLLGTVVGIISAFQGIAATGSGGLGSVSAGISEALVETALGLVVAIPAVLFFNQLNARISSMEGALGRAASELIDELENTHGNRARTSQLKAAAE